MSIENTSEYGRLNALAGLVNGYWTGKVSADKLAEGCLPDDYKTACGMLVMRAVSSAKSARKTVDSAVAEAMSELRSDISSLPDAHYRQQLRIGLISAGIGAFGDTSAAITQGAKQTLAQKAAEFRAAMESRYNAR